jgi:hypothetical protein
MTVLDGQQEPKVPELKARRQLGSVRKDVSLPASLSAAPWSSHPGRTWRLSVVHQWAERPSSPGRGSRPRDRFPRNTTTRPCGDAAQTDDPPACGAPVRDETKEETETELPQPELSWAYQAPRELTFLLKSKSGFCVHPPRRTYRSAAFAEPDGASCRCYCPCQNDCAPMDSAGLWHRLALSPGLGLAAPESLCPSWRSTGCCHRAIVGSGNVGYRS